LTIQSSPAPPPQKELTQASGKERSTWPRLWEYTLVAVLTVCAVLIAQAAWRVIRPPEPLGAALGSIDLNTADVATLKELPGVGPHLAARIVEYRDQHGPFASVDDLRNVSGIGPVSIQRLRPLLYVTKTETNDTTAMPIATEPKAKNPVSSPSSSARKAPDQLIDLNTATKEQLTAIPGIGATIAERIVEDRKISGPFKSVNDLTRIKGIKAKTVEKLNPYVKADLSPKQQ
jgi:competence ComEA-like helix-hairpin-helix protein